MISTYSGVHSIRIGVDPLATKVVSRRYRDTWEDWCLIPASRPYVTMPPVNEQYLEIPGMNGQYDITDKLHNYPTYGMREGSWEFHIAHDVAAQKFGVPEDHVWHVVCEHIANYLHGQGLRCILLDDPWWYYDGRFKLNAFKSNKYYSTVTIDYKLQPYKWSITTTLDTAWPWDPFAFQEGNTVPTTVGYNEDTNQYYATPKNSIWKQFDFDNPNAYQNIYVNGSMNIPQDYFGSAPVTPTFYVVCDGGTKEAYLHIDNSCTGVFTPVVGKPEGWDTGEWRNYYEDRGYHYTLLSALYDTAPTFVARKYYIRAGEATGDDSKVTHILRPGVNTLPDVQFVCPTSDDWVRVAIKGYGHVQVDFRMGRL